MTRKELRKYKKNHCFHSCKLCEWKKQCWEELNVEDDELLTWTHAFKFIIVPFVIGFLIMALLVYIICNGYMM